MRSINWGGLEPRQQSGITVACIKVAAVELKEALEASTSIADVSFLLDTAILMEREFASLADAAARKVDALDAREAVRLTGLAAV